MDENSYQDIKTCVPSIYSNKCQDIIELIVNIFFIVVEQVKCLGETDSALVECRL